jgi:hypothetical protein
VLAAGDFSVGFVRPDTFNVDWAVFVKQSIGKAPRIDVERGKVLSLLNGDITDEDFSSYLSSLK